MAKIARSALPRLEIQAREGLSFDLPKNVRARWNGALRAQADDATITIYDVIGPREGVSASRIAAALRSIGNRDVVVNINSPGGDMFEGIAFYNLLREHKGKVTVRVLGLAASAASIIAMAGDTIQVAKSAYIMVHNVWVLAIGNRLDLREVADFLEPFDKTLAELYTARTGGAQATIAALMDAETYMDGADAIERGFADELMPADEVEEERAAMGQPVAASAAPSKYAKDPRYASYYEGGLASAAAAGYQGSLAITYASAHADRVMEAVLADQERIRAILTHPHARGREDVANHLATQTDMTVDAAAKMLAMTPKRSRLDAVMNMVGTPGINSEDIDTPPGATATSSPISSTREIFARRAADVARQRETLSRGTP